MSSETTNQNPANTAQEDGEQYYRENFGIGLEEAGQEVFFGDRRGTVAEMIADKACPVAGLLRQAYSKAGLEGVQEMMVGFKILDPRFDIEFTDETVKYNEDLKVLDLDVKKKSYSMPTTAY